MPGDAHLPTARGIARQIRRGEHQNRRPRQGWILLHVRGDRKAIHLGHVRIEQHECEGLALRPGLLEPGERLPSAIDHGGPHLPATQHLLENVPVGGIIIDHQHWEVAYRYLRHGLGRGLRGMARPESGW